MAVMVRFFIYQHHASHSNGDDLRIMGICFRYEWGREMVLCDMAISGYIRLYQAISIIKSRY